MKFLREMNGTGLENLILSDFSTKNIITINSMITSKWNSFTSHYNNFTDNTLYSSTIHLDSSRMEYHSTENSNILISLEENSKNLTSLNGTESYPKISNSLLYHSWIRTLVLTLILGCVTVGTICGNSLVICAVWVDRSLHSSCNFYVLSLACTDLLIGLLVMPLSSSYEILGMPLSVIFQISFLVPISKYCKLMKIQQYDQIKSSNSLLFFLIVQIRAWFVS